MADTMSADLDWSVAERHPREVRKMYAEIGMAGMPALRLVLDPLQVRYERGERTDQLHAEMMATE